MISSKTLRRLENLKKALKLVKRKKKALIDDNLSNEKDLPNKKLDLAQLTENKKIKE